MIRNQNSGGGGQHAPECGRESHFEGSTSAGMSVESSAWKQLLFPKLFRNQGVNMLRIIQGIFSLTPLRKGKEVSLYILSIYLVKLF